MGLSVWWCVVVCVVVWGCLCGGVGLSVWWCGVACVVVCVVVCGCLHDGAVDLQAGGDVILIVNFLGWF